MGTIIGAVASSLYIVDAHRDIAVEAFTSLLLFKNFFSYALTTKAFNWILEQGVWRTFWIIGTVQVGVCLLTIPMCKLFLFLSFLPSFRVRVRCMRGFFGTDLAGGCRYIWETEQGVDAAV